MVASSAKKLIKKVMIKHGDLFQINGANWARGFIMTMDYYTARSYYSYNDLDSVVLPIYCLYLPYDAVMSQGDTIVHEGRTLTAHLVLPFKLTNTIIYRKVIMN